MVEKPDPTFTHRGDAAKATLGFMHSWTPASALTIKSDVLHVGNTDEDPDATIAACSDSELTQVLGTSDLTFFGGHSNSRIKAPVQGVRVQAQQLTRFGRHQLLVGGDFSRRRTTFGCHDDITSTLFSGSFTADQNYQGIERNTTGYLRDDVEVAR